MTDDDPNELWLVTMATPHHTCIPYNLTVCGIACLNTPIELSLSLSHPSPPPPPTHTHYTLFTHPCRRATSVGGTCTGEHGVGLGKMDLLIEEFGEEAIAVMKQLKLTFDPNNIMNPGKVIYL